jgi:MFS family permease
MARAVRAERPATFGDALRVREFRAVFLAQLLSELGDQLARVALSVLVYRASNSPLLTALAYALTYLPAALGGPLLGPIADRAPRRRVMVLSALIGAVLVGLMALPGLPLAVLFVLLAVTTLFQGPFEAARAALLPDILTGDTYVAGQSLGRLLNQSSQVVGFAFGGLLLSWLSPRTALAMNAGTFVVAALILRLGVTERAVTRLGQPTRFVQDIKDGARIVFASPLLRSLVALAWAGTAFTVVPEALAAPYAHHLHGGAPTTGVILASGPVGTAVGVIVISRFVSPALRMRLIAPLAFLACLPLIFCLADPDLGVVVALLVVSGMAMSFNVPANQAFVQALQPGVRGRAFGLAAGGLAVGQGLSLLFAGVIADWLQPPIVVGLAGVIGACSMAVITTMSRFQANLTSVRQDTLEAA